MPQQRQPTGTIHQLADLTENERLIPIMPMVYVAWSDGDLSDDEIRNIRAKAADKDWLDADARDKLAVWLNPDEPPSARKLNLLLDALHQAVGEMSSDERLSLADLGVKIARLDQEGEVGEVDEWLRDTTRDALEEIESALGVASKDACQDLLAPRDARPKAPIEEPEPAFDREAMTAYLDGDFRETWESMRTLLDGPEFDYVYELSKEEYREQVFEWLQILAEKGIGDISYPESVGGDDEMGRFITSFQSLAMFDQSLVVKFGVQFGLFGGSILFLGTEKHHEKYLPRVADLDLLGGFAMTELGHGSNVRDIETVARFDRENDEFVIATPCPSARKEWIGNAAAHGEMVTVFAQLEVGEESYGVHAFLVPIRDEDGNPLPNVRIEDCGHKQGLNGVDNGRLWFDRVRIPRENMLDRHGSVDENGEYSSPIPSSGKRFFTMLGTLVGGRVSVAGASLTAMKSALAIATRYGSKRRQFGPAGEPESTILDYRTHKRRLMPRIAAAYGLSFAIQYLKRRYLEKTEEDNREVEALAAGIKAYATWQANDAVQAARECCGGMGYLTENRISELRRDIDVYATFEGDNTVLMLLVARGMLGEFQSQFQDEQFFSIFRYVARQAATAVQELNPVITRTTDAEHLRSPQFQLNAMRYREQDLLRSAANRIKNRMDNGMPAFDAFNEVQDHLMSMATAHVERVIMEQFHEAVEDCEDNFLRGQLDQLRSLWAMDRLYQDIGWFLESGYVEPIKSRAIRQQLNKLCEKTREQAVHLVDAFGIPDSCLAAPIALDDVDV